MLQVIICLCNIPINDLQPIKFAHYFIWSNVDGQLHLIGHGCNLLQFVTMNNEKKKIEPPHSRVLHPLSII